MVGRVRIEIGGHVFTISRESMEKGPTSRLQKMYRSAFASYKTCVIVEERPHEMFPAILAMYQTGELHIPLTSCPGAFMNELNFWEIPVELLSPCCYNRMQSFYDEQQTLKQFKDSLEVETYPEAPQTSRCSLHTARFKLWNLVEYRNPSTPARVYFILSLLMVLLSIFILAVKTDSNFQRNMTNCERLEYMTSSGMENVELIRETFEKYCDEKNIPEEPKPYAFTIKPDKKPPEGFKYIFVKLPNDNKRWRRSGEYDNRTKANNFIGTRSKYVSVPNMKVAIYTLSLLEIITIAFFSVDLVLRLVSCPSLKHYFFCIINITDALALVCTCIHLLVLHMHKHWRYTDSWIDMLEYSQMLRALRLFRIVSNIRAGKVLAYSIRANLKDLFILCLFLIAGMCTFASCFYIAEDKKNVSSILIGWYWAVVTMTTVGYGDISPQSQGGRFVACICAMAGVLLFALTLPIFANHFLTLYQHSDATHAFQKHRGNDYSNVIADSQTACNKRKEKVKTSIKKDQSV